jgi:hypothetical protein
MEGKNSLLERLPGNIKAAPYREELLLEGEKMAAAACICVW